MLSLVVNVFPILDRLIDGMRVSASLLMMIPDCKSDFQGRRLVDCITLYDQSNGSACERLKKVMRADYIYTINQTVYFIL